MYNVFNAMYDFVRGKLQYAPKTVVDERRAMCSLCDANVMGMCTACGCNIWAKTALLKSECPIDFWPRLHEADSTTVDD